MKNPYRALSISSHDKALAASVVVTVLLSVVLMGLDQALRTAAAPTGIVSFELAGNFVRSQNMLVSWDEAARVNAALSLGIDFLYLVSYSACLSLACVRVAIGLGAGFPNLAAVGSYLGLLIYAAGALDAVENIALIRVLQGSPWEAWPRVALLCALPKFALVATALIYVPTAGVVSLIAGRSSR